MGCNNSVNTPEEASDIRITLSKPTFEKQLSTEKKIAKKFKSFEPLIEQLKALLKQDACYDYLFRAEYFEEMLNFSTSYVSHQQAMSVVSIVLQYMALTKNFINGRQNLKTRFKVDTLALQLSEAWLEIRSEVFFANKNVLKILNYLAREVDQRKCWFPHSYLNLKFDFSLEETILVATSTQQLCRYDERAFFYFSNYLLKCSQGEYLRSESVTLVEEKLMTLLQLVGNNFAKPLPLNGQEALFEHHQNYKSSIQQNASLYLDLGKIKPQQRIQSLENYIFEKAKASIHGFNKCNELFQQVCSRNGGSNYRSELRLKARSQQKQLLKIKEQLLGYHPQKLSIQVISKRQQKSSLDSIIELQYQQHQKEIAYFCQNFSGIVKFKIFNMVKNQCKFNSLAKLNQCCTILLKEITKNGFKLIDLNNRLRGGHGAPHILLRVLVDQTFCQVKLIFQYNESGFYFFHCLAQMTKSKCLSPLTQLSLYNEQISNSFLLQAQQMVRINCNCKIDYGERLTFVEAEPLLADLVKILPYEIDTSRKAHISIDFNLMLDEISHYTVIVEEFVNDQIKIDRTDKIRRIAEYLFYQKKYDLSEMLFSHYEKEISENHAYLFDKIKHKEKDFIKSEVQVLDFYADSIQFLAQIFKEKSAYSKAIECYQKSISIKNIAHQGKKQKVNLLNKIAQIKRIQKDYDGALKIYQQCAQISEKQSPQMSDIYHLIAQVCVKQAKLDEALKYQMDSTHIIEKKVGKGSLQYAHCLKHLGEMFKVSGNYQETIVRLQKRKQILQKLQSRYSLQYSELMRQLGLLEQKVQNTNKSLSNYQQSLEVMIKINGDHHEDSQKLYYKIGVIDQQLGNNKEAIQKLKTSLALANKIYSPNSLEYENIYSHLAIAYQSQGQYAYALQFFEKCSSIKKEKFGPKSKEYIRTIISIGVLFDQQGKVEEALQRYQQSLHLLAQLNLQQSPDYAILLNNMGLIAHDRGNYKNALEDFSKVLAIQEKLDLSATKQYANTLNNIGMVKDDMCRYSEALFQYKKSLSIYQKLKHSKCQIAATYNNIGTTLLHVLNYPQAMKFYEKALSLEESLRGSQSKEYSICLHCMGIIKYQQNRLQLAEKWYEQSKGIFKKARFTNTLEYAQLLVSFGKLYLKKREADQSLVYLDESLGIVAAINEKCKALPINIMLHKGIAHFSLGNLDESAKVLLKGLDLCQRHHLEYREYASINYNLGLIQFKKEKYFSSIKYFQKALRLQQQFHDNNWKMTAAKLAACYFINLNENMFHIYTSYISEDGVNARHQAHHENKKEKNHI